MTGYRAIVYRELKLLHEDRESERERLRLRYCDSGNKREEIQRNIDFIDFVIYLRETLASKGMDYLAKKQGVPTHNRKEIVEELFKVCMENHKRHADKFPIIDLVDNDIIQYWMKDFVSPTVADILERNEVRRKLDYKERAEKIEKAEAWVKELKSLREKHTELFYSLPVGTQRYFLNLPTNYWQEKEKFLKKAQELQFKFKTYDELASFIIGLAFTPYTKKPPEGNASSYASEGKTLEEVFGKVSSEKEKWGLQKLIKKKDTSDE